MVFLESPQAAALLVPALTAKHAVTKEDLAAVLARNRGYGKAVADVWANGPDSGSSFITPSPCGIEQGWTLLLCKAYFGWFIGARERTGGVSYKKFLQNTDAPSPDSPNDVERLAIEAAGLLKPYTAPESPKPQGPGQEYTLEQVVALSGGGLKGRDFDTRQEDVRGSPLRGLPSVCGDGAAYRTGPHPGRGTVQSEGPGRGDCRSQQGCVGSVSVHRPWILMAARRIPAE